MKFLLISGSVFSWSKPWLMQSPRLRSQQCDDDLQISVANCMGQNLGATADSCPPQKKKLVDEWFWWWGEGRDEWWWWWWWWWFAILECVEFNVHLALESLRCKIKNCTDFPCQLHSYGFESRVLQVVKIPSWPLKSQKRPHSTEKWTVVQNSWGYSSGHMLQTMPTIAYEYFDAAVSNISTYFSAFHTREIRVPSSQRRR